jgi:RpiR family transcriptional regulator, carbohydrate utilization regulator
MTSKALGRSLLSIQAGISSQLASLSPTRQAIIRPVIESPREFVLLNVRDLASKLNTGPTTVLRILNALDFESYRDFQRYLHELCISSATLLDSHTRPNRSMEMPSLLKSSTEQIEENLMALHRSLDMDLLLKVAKRISEARRILLLGGDIALTLVTYLEYHLTMIGLPVFAASAPGRATHLARSMTAQDIVIGITFHRGLRMTIDGLETAKENGAYCVAMTDSLLSPLLRFADDFFIVPVQSRSFASSYVAPLALIDSLTTAVMNLNDSEMMARLKEADEEQRRGYRWYHVES